MTFNYEQFRQGFRGAALARGIDPERGATEFQAVLILAEISTDLHHSRMRELVRAAADRQVSRRWFPSEGRGFLRDDGTLDEALVTKAEVAKWWKYLSRDDWKSGGDSPLVERQAFAAIRSEIKYLPVPREKMTLEEMGEAVGEVLKENPTQAAMRANQPQKEIV